MLIAICVAVQFIMRSRQVGRKQVKKAGEHREKESREAEVEQARMLLDDDNMDDTEATDLEDDDDTGDRLRRCSRQRGQSGWRL